MLNLLQQVVATVVVDFTGTVPLLNPHTHSLQPQSVVMHYQGYKSCNYWGKKKKAEILYNN